MASQPNGRSDDEADQPAKKKLNVATASTMYSDLFLTAFADVP